MEGQHGNDSRRHVPEIEKAAPAAENRSASTQQAIRVIVGLGVIAAFLGIVWAVFAAVFPLVLRVALDLITLVLVFLARLFGLGGL